jgi:hypothetical protein
MQKENSKKIIWGVVGIIVLIGVFYGGMVYGKSQIPARGNQAFGQNGALGAGGMRGARNSGGFTVGQIISKDANSITVQLMTGGPGGTTTQSGSKIIFLGTGTTVTKTVAGTLADLTVGTQVSVTGTPNTDGSENAISVQIRPNTPQGARVQ